MREETLFNLRNGFFKKAIKKECDKIILVKYYEYNVKHNAWIKLYDDERIKKFSNEDFEWIRDNYLIGNGWIKKEYFKDRVKYSSDIKNIGDKLKQVIEEQIGGIL